MLFVLFKQKTAYEMRISYCGSYVCSSDLPKKRKAADGTLVQRQRYWCSFREPLKCMAMYYVYSYPEHEIRVVEGTHNHLPLPKPERARRSEESRVGNECLRT